MWKVLEAGFHVVFCSAQPQEGVPQVHQETCCRLLQQAQQQWRRQWQSRWQLHKGNTQEGLQGSHHRLPRLQHPNGLTEDPTPQQMRQVPPLQVPQGLKVQEGLIGQQEEEEEGCKPC